MYSPSNNDNNTTFIYHTLSGRFNEQVFVYASEGMSGWRLCGRLMIATDYDKTCYVYTFLSMCSFYVFLGAISRILSDKQSILILLCGSMRVTNAP